jgi:hypothetical protein
MKLKTRVILHALGLSFVLAVFIAINNIVKTFLLESSLGYYPAHLINISNVLIFVALVSYLLVTQMKFPFSKRDYFIIGLFWGFLGTAFNIVFEYHVMGDTWEAIIAEFSLLDGRLSILIFISAFMAPLMSYWLYSRRHNLAMT